MYRQYLAIYLIIVLTISFDFQSVFVSCEAIARKVSEEKIFGGVNSDIKDYPYVVSIRKSNGEHICGGTVLDHYHILTAAHCFEDQKIVPTFAIIGSSFLNKGGRLYTFKTVSIYPEYNPYTMANDLALITLSQKITYNAAFIKRSTNGVTDPTQSCIILGWGLDEKGDLSNQLKSASVYVIPQYACKDIWPPPRNNVEKSICTYKAKSGVCMGDSGGPLVCQNNILFGVLSFGKPCAVGTPDVQVDIHFYNNWINSILKLTPLLKKLEAGISQDFENISNWI